MIKEFENLREDEVKVLFDAPLYVAILIAGADGNIDKTEKKVSADVIRLKKTRGREQLIEYYKQVGENYEERLNGLISVLPSDTEEREKELVRELRKLNFIFPKIDKKFAVKLYASLREKAKKIAESSGGIFGYLSIGYEERKFMDLKMIKNPEKQ